jgi:hypothetical protein
MDERVTRKRGGVLGVDTAAEISHNYLQIFFILGVDATKACQKSLAD